MSDITDSEILSKAMPEQMTDKALYRFARAMILIGSQAQQERVAALEAEVAALRRNNSRQGDIHKTLLRVIDELNKEQGNE